MSDRHEHTLCTHVHKAPGMPCPNCKAPIVIDAVVLLSAAPIECAACGLELKVNTEKSEDALNALSTYMNAFALTKEHFENKVEDVTGAREERGIRKPRSGRAPSRRPRRGQSKLVKNP